jgi:hypothetical protein
VVILVGHEVDKQLSMKTYERRLSAENSHMKITHPSLGEIIHHTLLDIT